MKRALLAAAMLLATHAVHAQGCSQCRDNLATTPPKTQAAYRHAILLLVAAGGGVFLTSIAILKRYR